MKIRGSSLFTISIKSLSVGILFSCLFSCDSGRNIVDDIDKVMKRDSQLVSSKADSMRVNELLLRGREVIHFSIGDSDPVLKPEEEFVDIVLFEKEYWEIYTTQNQIWVYKLTREAKTFTRTGSNTKYILPDDNALVRPKVLKNGRDVEEASEGQVFVMEYAFPDYATDWTLLKPYDKPYNPGRLDSARRELQIFLNAARNKDVVKLNDLRTPPGCPEYSMVGQSADIITNLSRLSETDREVFFNAFQGVYVHWGPVTRGGNWTRFYIDLGGQDFNYAYKFDEMQSKAFRWYRVTFNRCNDRWYLTGVTCVDNYTGSPNAR